MVAQSRLSILLIIKGYITLLMSSTKKTQLSPPLKVTIIEMKCEKRYVSIFIYSLSLSPLIETQIISRVAGNSFPTF